MSEKSRNRPYLNDAPKNASFPTYFMTPGTDIRWLSNAYDANGGEADYFGANNYQYKSLFCNSKKL